MKSGKKRRNLKGWEKRGRESGWFKCSVIREVSKREKKKIRIKMIRKIWKREGIWREGRGGEEKVNDLNVPCFEKQVKETKEMRIKMKWTIWKKEKEFEGMGEEGRRKSDFNVQSFEKKVKEKKKRRYYLKWSAKYEKREGIWGERRKGEEKVNDFNVLCFEK